MWVYLAHGSHDTLGNKHSHFLSGRLLWINKQDCGAALVWKSRDKPPLLRARAGVVDRASDVRVGCREVSDVTEAFRRPILSVG